MLWSCFFPICLDMIFVLRKQQTEVKSSYVPNASQILVRWKMVSEGGIKHPWLKCHCVKISVMKFYFMLKQKHIETDLSEPIYQSDICTI